MVVGVTKLHNEECVCCVSLVNLVGIRIINCLCSLQYKLSDENSYHVRYVELEMKDKPISVMINNDPSTIIDHVIR